MSEPRGNLVALTTAPIFDDAVYFVEALNLVADQNEEDLWNELTKRAKESGIEDPYRFLCPLAHDISSATSTTTADSENRSSMSIHSQETQCTGLTSTSVPSRVSRDQPYYIKRSSSQRLPTRLAQASLSVDNVNVMEKTLPASPSMPIPKQRHSTSSVARHGFSSLALQKPSPRRQRSLALFAMFRRGSNNFTSPSHHHEHHAKAQGAKSKYDPSLSTKALRADIRESLKSKGQVAPNCCDEPLSRTALEIVLSKEETDIALSDHLQSPSIAPSYDSGYSENGMFTMDLPDSLESTLHTETTLSTPTGQLTQEEIGLERLVENEAIKAFRAQQQEQYQRVSAFECNQRKALSAYYQSSLKQLEAQYEATKREKIEQHTIDMDNLEEAQIMAEHDLRKTQMQEVQNMATALKYMEAYCSGTNSLHPDLAHTVTEDDHNKLARQRVIQQNLPQKHNSTINVLRARQERDVCIKQQSQEAEIASLEAAFLKEKAELEQQNIKETDQLDALIEARRKKLVQRWTLEFEICRRTKDGSTETFPHHRLDSEKSPPVDWHTASSVFAQYLHAVT